MKLALVALALAGCLNSELVECDDGRLCPRGTACDVVHHTCVAPEQLVVCENVADFEPCDAVANGRCFDGVCLPGGCGNGFEEPEENCDDGNVQAGDGCSADCASEERCGDGFADVARGEECDDGNTRGRDGCTNACTLERLVFREHLYKAPVPRQNAAAAYDPLAREIIVFGGIVPPNDETLGDTWSLTGYGLSFALGFGPPRRTQASMTYDERRHRIVMFGGFSTGSEGLLLNDTWEWRGALWERRTSAVNPPARLGGHLAWDGARVILFGGTQLLMYLNDTWAWDGAQWTRLLPATSPPRREGGAIAYDPKHARVVLFGGRVDMSALADTWVFDGTNWTLQNTPGPPAMSWSALAYDSAREVLVLSGVRVPDFARVVWELNGSTWIEKPSSTTPNTTTAILAYDAARGRVVQFGGLSLTSGLITNEVWEWDGATWSLRGDPLLPTPRIRCGIASDPVRGRVVMFGGDDAAKPPNQLQVYSDTWEWDGQGWRPAIAISPPARTLPAMAFDGQGVLLFGGAGAQLYADTWRWDGTSWQAMSSTGPAGRAAAGMTYDSKRKRVLLFGGTSFAQAFDDTWQWDGSTWTRIITSNAPSPRSFARLAHDTVRDRVVLFGGVGLDNVTQLDDTWEFDGTTWTEIMPAVRPEPRTAHALIYDRARGRVVLLGGHIAGFLPMEWDGTNWTQPEVAQVPRVKNTACTTYDDARAEIIMFGGELTGANNETSSGGYRGEFEEVCGSGLDLDGDGATGCDDDDCRFTCAPQCWDDPNCP